MTWMTHYPLADVRRIAKGGPEVKPRGRLEAVRELRLRGENAGEVVLSPAQYATAGQLCVAARGLSAEALGATARTLSALEKLGIVEARSCGALEPLYHLTSFGREAVCGHTDDDPAVGRLESDGDPVGPLPEGGTEMSTTEVTQDPKTGKKPRKTAAQKRAEAEAAAVPAVEDVTGAVGVKADLTPLFDDLLAKVLELTGSDAVVEKKAAYTRVSLGKAVVYINNPTSKSVRVEVPEKDGPGYDVIKVVKANQIPAVLVLAGKRVDVLKAKAAAKEAAAA